MTKAERLSLLLLLLLLLYLLLLTLLLQPLLRLTRRLEVIDGAQLCSRPAALVSRPKGVQEEGGRGGSGSMSLASGSRPAALNGRPEERQGEAEREGSRGVTRRVIRISPL